MRLGSAATGAETGPASTGRPPRPTGGGGLEEERRILVGDERVLHDRFAVAANKAAKRLVTFGGLKDERCQEFFAIGPLTRLVGALYERVQPRAQRPRDRDSDLESSGVGKRLVWLMRGHGYCHIHGQRNISFISHGRVIA